MNKSVFIAKIGFLKPDTTTVEGGNHFRNIRCLIDELTDEKFSVSIDCNKWILTKMLELECCWDGDAKETHRLLHNQLTKNLK